MSSLPIIPSCMAWRAFHHWSELVVWEPTCSTRPVFMAHRSRSVPRPPTPMTATLMRSFAPRTRAWAWAGAARPTTPRATPAPTADFTKSRRPSLWSPTVGLLSERELHPELHVALARLAEHAAERRAARVDADASVGRVGGVAAIRVSEVRVVQEVEELGPELQPALSADAHVLEYRDVPVREPGGPQDVAARVAERPRRWSGEGRGIEPEVL